MILLCTWNFMVIHSSFVPINECGTNRILTYCHTLRLLWHLPLHFLQYQQQQPLFHFNHPQSSKLWKKQFSPAVSNVEVGCERAPNYASWGGLANYSNSCKKLFVVFRLFSYIVGLFLQPNTFAYHSVVWELPKLLFLNAGCSSVL